MAEETPACELEGRELDAAVARKVMGRGFVDDAWAWPVGGDWVLSRDTPTRAPPHSTDISAAWEVVEAVVWGDSDDFVLLRTSGRWTAGEAGYDMVNPNGPHATADTAAEAICRAALEAVRHASPPTSP